jgi:hypothetical protein
MATAYSELYSKFLIQNQDYKIDLLATAATPVVTAYLFGFLELAIPEFTNCVQDLEDRDTDDEDGEFNITLTGVEQKILVNWMTYHWFLREVHNVTAFNSLLNDSEFRRFSEANNLKEKSAYANGLREIYTQKMVDYGISEIPWDDWLNGEYG